MAIFFCPKPLRFGIGSIFLALMTLPAWAAEDPAAPYYQAHTLVQVAPGRKLNLYCVGKGSPVVIFDYGWGGPPTTWEFIQPAIGRKTTACTYDRAGYGFSDPGPMPRDTAAIVTDLRLLLVAAHLKPPYVFVGHSMAGLAGAMFADKYLGDLAGMVLVDPAFAHQDETFNALPGVAQALAKSKPDLSECAEVAKAGQLPTDTKQVQDCLDRDPHDSELAKAVKDKWDMSPERWTTLQSELESSTQGSDRDGAELDAAKRDWGSLPLIVLTSGDKHFAGFPPQQAASMKKLWREGHEELASRSKRGTNRVIPGSDHYIQIDHPALVIEAIEQVLQMAKKHDGPSPKL